MLLLTAAGGDGEAGGSVLTHLQHKRSEELREESEEGGVI